MWLRYDLSAVPAPLPSAQGDVPAVRALELQVRFSMGGAHLSLLPMEGVHWPRLLPLGFRLRTLCHMHQVRCCHGPL